MELSFGEPVRPKPIDLPWGYGATFCQLDTEIVKTHATMSLAIKAAHALQVWQRNLPLQVHAIRSNLLALRRTICLELL